MDGNRHNPPLGDKKDTRSSHTSQQDQSADLISIEQLQRLVHLLDQSSVSELELKRDDQGTRLVLRKVKAPAAENGDARDGAVLGTQFIAPAKEDDPTPAADTEHKVLAHLVGTFHSWARPRGGVLVAVGDRVKAGQLVGTIESLNVFNEVEAPVAGHVAEIFVQDGQPVEYGQLLMTIADSNKG